MEAKQEIAIEEMYADFVTAYRETLAYLEIPDNGTLENIDEVFNILAEKNFNEAAFFKGNFSDLIMRRFYMHFFEDSSIIKNPVPLHEEFASITRINIDGDKSLSIRLFDMKLEGNRKVKKLLEEAMSYYLCEIKDGKLHHNGIDTYEKANDYFAFLVKTSDVFRVPDNVQKRYPTIEYNYNKETWDRNLISDREMIEDELFYKYGSEYSEKIEDYDYLLYLTRKLRNGYKIYQKLLESPDGPEIIEAVNNGMNIKQK